MKVPKGERKFHPAIKVGEIPAGGFDAILTGRVDEGQGEDNYAYYVGFRTTENKNEQFFGVDTTSLSWTNITDAFGDETDNWEGCRVHIGTAEMSSGRYKGTVCLSVTAVPGNTAK